MSQPSPDQVKRETIEACARVCEGNFDSEMKAYGDHFAASIRSLKGREMSDTRQPGPIVGHPSIGPQLTEAEWPTWAEIDEVAKAHDGDPLMAKILRAAHAGIMHGPHGLRLLYDIRHAMGWNDLTGLSIMASGIAEMRKSYLWGPIEYAPKDGTHVLVKFEGTMSPPTVAHYWSAPDDPGGWFLSVQQNEGPEIYPTHWQRLPAERA